MNQTIQAFVSQNPRYNVTLKTAQDIQAYLARFGVNPGALVAVQTTGTYSVDNVYTPQQLQDAGMEPGDAINFYLLAPQDIPQAGPDGSNVGEVLRLADEVKPDLIGWLNKVNTIMHPGAGAFGFLFDGEVAALVNKALTDAKTF